MQESLTLGNEQETTNLLLRIGWLAGLIDGEGTVLMQAVKSKAKNGNPTYTYHPRITIYNNDEGLISAASSLLDQLGIKFYLQQRASRDPRNNNEKLETVNHTITITEAVSVKLLLEFVMQSLQTVKKFKASLCLRFLNLRLTRKQYYGHTDEEVSVIQEYLKLVGSSTTVRKTEKGTLFLSEETV